MTTEKTKAALDAQWQQWWHGTKYCQVVSIGYTDTNLREASLESYREGYRAALTAQSEAKPADDEVLGIKNGAIHGDIFRETVKEAMQQAWNDHCADTGCFPDDFEMTKRELSFTAGRFAEHAADIIFNSKYVKDIYRAATAPKDCDYPDDGLPCVCCGKPSHTATPDDADMCWKCFGEFNATEYDNLKKDCDALVKALDKIRDIDVTEPERYVRKADEIACYALAAHRAKQEQK